MELSSMARPLGILEATLFPSLSLLHFYWALGGTWGFANAIPTKEDGERTFDPSPRASAAVGLVLFLLGLYYALSFLLEGTLPDLFTPIGWFVAAVFFVRAIGDGRYVGFFKRIRNTAFGRRDTAFYSPLCLLIATLALLVELG